MRLSAIAVASPAIPAPAISTRNLGLFSAIFIKMLQSWKPRKPGGSPKIVVVGSLLEVTPVTGSITS
ncbi:hypothetical protein DPV78_000425 [Talaromyces pinophilus]|nr:hypothetical protein DPV78_000425 [Talaromyces pinophilus]